MPRFFVEPPVGEDVRLQGEDARHISGSLRMRPGEELILCDGRGTDYRCVLESVTSQEVWARVDEKLPSRGECRCRVTLYQALPKGDKLELIVQKAVELGAAAVVPVLTERCVSRPDAKSAEKKRERLQKISLEAAKQAGRGLVPEVRELISFSRALEEMAKMPLGILFYEKEVLPLHILLSQEYSEIGIFVGSEGGFSPAEASSARDKGVQTAGLGSRILRCETAPLCALSAIFYAQGEY